MSDTNQATLAGDSDGSGMDSDATIDDDGLLDKVRASGHPAVRCGYCNEVALDGYLVSAHGREYCPECGTVVAAEQRRYRNTGWMDR